VTADHGDCLNRQREFTQYIDQLALVGKMLEDRVSIARWENRFLLRGANHWLIIKAMNTERVIEVLNHALAPLASRLACAYLFGSFARGEARPGSDMDIALLFHQEPPCSLDGLGMDFAGAIEDATGKRADVVVLNRASPDLIHRVLRDGVLILENDRPTRIGFEVRARAEYFDVLPYIREYRHTSDSPHDRP
jgi:predicted nucleotidyltransferase